MSLRPPGFDIIPDDQEAAIEGEYDVPTVGLVRIVNDGDDLILRVGGGFPYHAYLVENKVVYVSGIDVWLWFSKGGPWRSSAATVAVYFRRQ